MKLVTLALAAAATLLLAACNPDSSNAPAAYNVCTAWTRTAYIAAAVASPVRHLTEAQATTERDTYCGVGK